MSRIALCPITYGPPRIYFVEIVLFCLHLNYKIMIFSKNTLLCNYMYYFFNKIDGFTSSYSYYGELNLKPKFTMLMGLIVLKD